MIQDRTTSSALTAKTTGGGLQTISLREAEEKISALHGRLEPVDGQPNQYCVPRALAPSTVERRQLSAVAARLELDLEAAGTADERGTIISRLLLGFEKGRGSTLNAGLLNAEFLDAVKGLPLVAIREAAERFKTGQTLKTWDPDWRPSPARFAAEVREGLVPKRVKLVQIGRVLKAKVYDPPTEEQRELVAEAMRQFLEDRRAFNDDRPVSPTREQTAAALNDQIIALRDFDKDPSLSHLIANLDDRRARG